METPETETQAAKSSPWDVFIHLLAVIALYISVYSAITLLFQYVNLALPDPLDDNSTFSYREIRFAISMLVIFFPAYCWAWRRIGIDLAANPGKGAFWVRTCPIYLTLFLAGLLALGDLACLVYYFMNGELTSRFLLKVAAILTVAGAVLWYYRDTLRRVPGATSGLTRAFEWSATVAVAGMLVAGFVIAGPPARARNENFDAQRVRDLSRIQSKLVDYWANKGGLPANLDQLRDSISGYVPATDPESHQAYGYFVRGATSFELCGDFELASDEKQQNPYYLYTRGVGPSNWAHKSGHFCYQRTIDPAVYRKDRSAAPAPPPSPVSSPAMTDKK